MKGLLLAGSIQERASLQLYESYWVGNVEYYICKKKRHREAETEREHMGRGSLFGVLFKACVVGRQCVVSGLLVSRQLF